MECGIIGDGVIFSIIEELSAEEDNMIVLHQFFNGEEKEFLRIAEENFLQVKKQANGMGRDPIHNQVYTFQWLETSEPNYTWIVKELKKGAGLNLYFYNDMYIAQFVDALCSKLPIGTVSYSMLSLTPQFMGMEYLDGIYVKYNGAD